MTDKELRRLNRRELLELLVAQSREIDRLRAQLDTAEQRLADRQLQINQAGSIAEASLQINQVFEAAQRAAEQYLENVRSLSARQEQLCRQQEQETAQKTSAMLAEAEQRCRALEAATAKNCAAMIREANQAFTKARGTMKAAGEPADTPPASCAPAPEGC